MNKIIFWFARKRTNLNLIALNITTDCDLFATWKCLKILT